MFLSRMWLLLAVVVLLLAACTLNTNSAPTNAPLIAPPVVNNDLPVAGYADIEPSGVVGCVLKNAGSVPIIVYSDAHVKSTPVAAFQSGTGLAGYKYQDGWYQVSFTIGQTEVMGWVAEAEIVTTGDCLDIQPPAGCSVQPSVGRVIDIYAQPDRNSLHVSALNERYFLPFIQLNADGWFNVDIGGGQSGWVAPDEGHLVGACDNGK